MILTMEWKNIKQIYTKIEHRTIIDWIEKSASVLDLGCGDGELMTKLTKEKQVRAQGIEINEQSIHRCVAIGLSVFQEDIDSGLSDY